MFAIQYLGNVNRCRTEAEVVLTDRDVGDPLVALVYESEHGIAVQYFGRGANDRELPGLNDAVADAYLGLQRFINRRGIAPPEGLSRAGLSLWLLMKDDRTALGDKLG
jgi:hypothetical protein